MAVTIRELDRLVSKTHLTPLNKRALREVRRAVITGRASDPVLGSADWEVSIGTKTGGGMRLKFSFKKVKND